MDSMIREINENLKAIIDNLKETRDNSIGVLDNIQLQMDKKVEEAKKYKVQVDSSKERIKALEEENKSLELSLNELSDKYGKMNLVSVVEAGNREIKNKINNNLKDINQEKEHIADLTNRARTIKDLLINLKKDKTAKESRLENLNVVYDYYNERVNEIIDYAFNHSENLGDYKIEVQNPIYEAIEDDEEVRNIELENTMVFDEIANIDESKIFKDEMTFINDQITDIDNSINLKEEIQDFEVSNEIVDNVKEEKDEFVEKKADTTQVFDAILNVDVPEDLDVADVEQITEIEDTEAVSMTEPTIDLFVDNEIVNNENAFNPFEVEEVNNIENENDGINLTDDLYKNFNFNLENDTNELGDSNFDDKALDEENEKRLNQINDLFANFENTTNLETSTINTIENKIDNAYVDVFGKPLEEDDLNKKQPTLTDIFGNPISKDELSEETIISKKMEELFLENGIDINKFREDEKNYLKQIYDEEKFNNILEVLKRNKINLDNIYDAFNIFGEITANELENIINKLLNVGQSIEAIGLVLEKLPKVKKYNLDEAIMSYGDYIRNIDITELIMKAKELYKNGGNV